MVADARAGPHVVHCPYHGLARGQYLFDILQGEHALVDPVQVDDVGLAEFGQGGDVRPRVGNVYGKEVVLLEAVGFPDDDAFPYELPHHPPVAAQGHDRDVVGLLVAHQQLGLDAVVLQGFCQAAGGYGGSADSFGCIDKQDSHFVEWSVVKQRIDNEMPVIWRKSSGFR